jgi:hypothetical protein
VQQKIWGFTLIGRLCSFFGLATLLQKKRAAFSARESDTLTQGTLGLQLRRQLLAESDRFPQLSLAFGSTNDPVWKGHGTQIEFFIHNLCVDCNRAGTAKTVKPPRKL